MRVFKQINNRVFFTFIHYFWRRCFQVCTSSMFTANRLYWTTGSFRYLRQSCRLYLYL